MFVQQAPLWLQKVPPGLQPPPWHAPLLQTPLQHSWND
jgi:hypothetical protein